MGSSLKGRHSSRAPEHLRPERWGCGSHPGAPSSAIPALGFGPYPPSSAMLAVRVLVFALRVLVRGRLGAFPLAAEPVAGNVLVEEALDFDRVQPKIDVVAPTIGIGPGDRGPHDDIGSG
jgi:hypothetical protein